MDQHVNPFSEFNPISLSFRDDDNLLNNFNHHLSTEFGNLDEFGLGSNQSNSNNNDNQFLSRFSNGSDKVNLNNVGSGFLDDTRVNGGGSSSSGGNRVENYSYVGNITDNDSRNHRNQSVLFDSRVPDNNNNNNNNGNNNFGGDSFRNSALHKQNSFINSIKNQNNQRLSQDSFINKHLSRYQQSPLQRSQSQPQSQPQSQQKQQIPNINNQNFQNSLPFDNFNGDDNILRDTTFSFNVSNPNIDINDVDFYGSQNNRFNKDFINNQNNNPNINNIGNTRQNGSNQFTDINGQSVIDTSLMYSPATNYQDDDDDDNNNNDINNSNNNGDYQNNINNRNNISQNYNNSYNNYQHQYQEPHVEVYEDDQYLDNNEDNNNNNNNNNQYDGEDNQYNNNSNNNDDNNIYEVDQINRQSLNNSNQVFIQDNGEAKTPGTYFQYKSPHMGRLSGTGSGIEFGETINDDGHYERNQNNHENNNNELNFSSRNQSMNGGGGATADNNSINQTFRNSRNQSMNGGGGGGGGGGYQNTPNGTTNTPNHNNSHTQTINGSGVGRMNNYVSPILTNISGDVSNRTGQNDTTYASIGVPNDPSHVGYTPTRGNLDYDTYQRLKERYLNPKQQLPQQPQTQQHQHQLPQQQSKQQTQIPPKSPKTNNNSFLGSSLINNSQYQQKIQQEQNRPKTPQQQQQQQQQNRPKTPQQQQTIQQQQQIDDIDEENYDGGIIKYPMVVIEKRIDLGKCELEWVLSRDLIVTNPHSKPVTLSNINIFGLDKDAFRIIVSDKTNINNNNNNNNTQSFSSNNIKGELAPLPPIIIIQPLSHIFLKVQYTPNVDNLPKPESNGIHYANLVLTCSGTVPLNLNDSETEDEFRIQYIPQSGVYNLSIPINGTPTADILNHEDLLYSYNNWDMGECNSTDTLTSNLSLKSQNGQKLIYEINGEGFSFEKLSNDQISLKFTLPEKQIYNADATIIDQLTGQKKLIKLSATITNNNNNNNNSSNNITKIPSQKPLIIDPSPTQSPSTLSSQQIKQEKSKSFTPKFILKKEKINDGSSDDNDDEDDENDEDYENIDNNSRVPLSISNYVLENGIKLVYEERKKIYPIETLSMYCNFSNSSSNNNSNNRGELIDIECISTQPDVFSISPSIFSVEPNSMIPLQIKYQPNNNIQLQRAAIIISTPSITKEKIKIDVIGITVPLDSTLYMPSSPPSPTYQSKRFNNIRKDNYDSGNKLVPSTKISSEDVQDNLNINNSSVIFHNDDDAEFGDDSNLPPSLYCNRKVVNFGGVKLGDTKSVLITLTSTLPHALHLNATFKQQQQNAHSFFSIGNGEQLLISPNSKTEVEIIYTPLSVSPHGSVIVFSSLNKQLSFSIPVLGYGGSAKMEVASSARNLDSIDDNTSRGSNNNNIILYVNKQSTDGKSVYCKFTVKNTGQRSGFVRAISFYPNSKSTIKPDRVSIGVGEQVDFRLEIHPTSASGGSGGINNLLSQLNGSSLMNSTVSPGKVKLYFGDEISRQRKIRSIHNRLDNLKTDSMDSTSKEVSFDDEFLFDFKFKDEEIQDIQFKETFINENSQQINDSNNQNYNFDLDDYDDVELFFNNLSSIKITPIIGNPPTKQINNNNNNNNNSHINSNNNNNNDIFINMPSSNKKTTTTPTPTTTPINGREFELSEMDLNNTPFKATTNLPFPTNSVLNANTNSFNNTTTAAAANNTNLKSILKKPQPSVYNNINNNSDNSLFNTFENTLRFNPTVTTTTTDGIKKSEEVRHYHIHQFEPDQPQQRKQQTQPSSLHQQQPQLQKQHTNGILFFYDNKVTFGIVQIGQSSTNKVSISNASNATLNVRLSLPSPSPFILNHHTITLNPKTTTKVPIIFKPKEIGTFSQLLKVESIPKTLNDPILTDTCELISESKTIPF
ncbi:hypothetical protein ACTFIU_007900 [Dictyostelium citrinum]